jgi:hypothetical protein
MAPVDGGDLALTVIDVPHPVLGRGTDPDRLADQAPTDEDPATPPLDGAMDGHDAHLVVRARDEVRLGVSPRCAIMRIGNQRQELNGQPPGGHEPGEPAAVGNLTWRLRRDAEE